VLPAGAKRVAIEAGSRESWWRYVGHDGAVVGMDTFGASAPAKKLFEHFGFTAAGVARVAADLL
jgi:transketolase